MGSRPCFKMQHHDHQIGTLCDRMFCRFWCCGGATGNSPQICPDERTCIHTNTHANNPFVGVLGGHTTKHPWKGQRSTGGVETACISGCCCRPNNKQPSPAHSATNSYRGPRCQSTACTRDETKSAPPPGREIVKSQTHTPVTRNCTPHQQQQQQHSSKTHTHRERSTQPLSATQVVCLCQDMFDEGTEKHASMAGEVGSPAGRWVGR